MKQKNIFTILIAVGIILFGLIAGQIIIKTSPKAQKSSPKEKSTIVTTTILSQASNEITIHATGNVQSSKETKISSEVTGSIVYVSQNANPGSKVQAGDVLFEIDKINYEVALAQSEAALKNAQAQRSLELGQQEIAKKDLQISGRNLTKEQKALTLREPQLAIAQAQIQEAQAQILKAKSDLGKTTIRAPFDGIIADVPPSLGTMVGSGTNLTTIVNNQTLWIFVEIDANLLEHIDFTTNNTQGSSAKIKPLSFNSDKYFDAKVVSLLPKSQSSSKRPIILIEANITEKETQTIFNGDLVSVEIEGIPIDNSILIPWTILRNDKFLWIYDDNELKIKEIDVLFRHKDYLIIKSDQKNIEAITSNISNPQEGQKLQKASK